MESYAKISTHTLTWSVTTLMGRVVSFVEISTHTLTWSVTLGSLFLTQHPAISTHTLTWSVTNVTLMRHNPQTDFNSHAHVERDGLIPIALYMRGISTHTLTWSVTQLSFNRNRIFRFQLTRSRGA